MEGCWRRASKQIEQLVKQIHRVSRGIHDKGHSRTRKLLPPAADELAGFERTWNGNANMEIPGWKSGSDFHANAGTSSNSLTNWDPFSGVRPNTSAQPGAGHCGSKIVWQNANSRSFTHYHYGPHYHITLKHRPFAVSHKLKQASSRSSQVESYFLFGGFCSQ
ncbi:hypothetical protein HAX54_050865 [Datura stramonium]|uniref:Uncharacterized protein n=1 Tax=Datura stramonium TaxID=4076 RepID=A0ABS8SXI6_DATST|nr:hypothetical protein [Datura stramonium]